MTKKWEGSGNKDGIRPTSATVNLYGCNKAVVADAEIEADADGNRSCTFNELRKYPKTANRLDDYVLGTPIQYVVEEVGVPEGYKCAVSGDVEKGFVVTNTHKVKDPTDPKDPVNPDKPGDKPTAPTQPSDKPADRPNSDKPADRPNSDKPADKPADKSEASDKAGEAAATSAAAMPQTGDNALSFAFGLIALMAGAALVAIVAHKRAMRVK